MKLDRIIWGILLLFIGGVILLDNFNVIDFYWFVALRFLPVLIIIFGVNLLFNKKDSQTGNIISLAILIIALGFLFVKGQQRPDEDHWWSRKFKGHFKYRNDNDKYRESNFVAPFEPGDELKKANLKIAGGATSFEIESTTDSLFTAAVTSKFGEFMLSKIAGDTVNALTFKMKDGEKHNWDFGDKNSVALHLNTKPIWDIEMDMGVGDVDFDLSPYKVSQFRFNGGAADLDVKIGDLLPITTVNVNTGLTDVKIKVPQSSGCRIKAKTGMSSRDFDGFNKVGNNLYETPNFNSAKNKVFINFDGGLAKFHVEQY